MNSSKKYANLKNSVAIALWTTSWAGLSCAGVSQRDVQPLPTPGAGSTRLEQARAPAVPIIVEHSPGELPLGPPQAALPAEHRPPQLSPIVVSEPLGAEAAPGTTVPSRVDPAAPSSGAAAPDTSKRPPGSTPSVPAQPAAPKSTSGNPRLDAAPP
jgi:hypothetical protein